MQDTKSPGSAIEHRARQMREAKKNLIVAQRVMREATAALDEAVRLLCEAVDHDSRKSSKPP
jgi:hypothetical protein